MSGPTGILTPAPQSSARRPVSADWSKYRLALKVFGAAKETLPYVRFTSTDIGMFVEFLKAQGYRPRTRTHIPQRLINS